MTKANPRWGASGSRQSFLFRKHRY